MPPEKKSKLWLWFVAAFVVHPVMAHFEAAPLSIVRAIYSKTTDGAALVSEVGVTAKFLVPMYGHRVIVDRGDFDVDEIERLRSTYGAVYIVLLDRYTGSSLFEGLSAQGREMIAQVSRRCHLDLTDDQWPDREDHLRIWSVGDCVRLR